jgi:hypothetical protein
MLSRIAEDLDEVALDFRYTAENYNTGSRNNPTQEVRALLDRTRLDVAELPILFREMATLLINLKFTKRYAVCPPPPLPVPSPEEVRAYAEKAAMQARAERVQVSRKWLREMWHKEKHSDTDVRCRTRWIALEGIVTMLCDDVTGYANAKPLWPSVPSPEQLAKDYGLSAGEARRVLGAYRESTTA